MHLPNASISNCSLSSEPKTLVVSGEPLLEVVATYCLCSRKLREMINLKKLEIGNCSRLLLDLAS